MLMQFMGLITGMLPEAIFISFIIIRAKEATFKQGLLTGIGTFLIVFGLSLIMAWNVWFYLIFFIIEFALIKAIYNAPIADITLITFAIMILVVTSFFCKFLIPSFLLALLIHKFVLLIIAIELNHYLSFLYKTFVYSWDRRIPTLGVKSLTVRNLSIVALNVTFILLIVSLTLLAQGGI